ncbi:hypothetical protein [Paenibacillus algorifonticola]|uniref:hypothetical protein n=1 Tax=Paenibacillus algorifonticola TaxID=684063 RepID=UPI00061983CD|nr:hypothetical protein [Paenibacillus algorifonticola]
MAQVHHVLNIALDPLKPVPEICAVIKAIVPYHPDQEEAILIGVQEALQGRLNQIRKGAAADGE